jgi:hypothetical protein
MKDGPLSRLRRALLSGDIVTAIRILRRTPWTNLPNALRALPPSVQPVAYQLLDHEQTTDVANQLTPEEQAQLRQQTSEQDPPKPPD